MCFIFIGIGEIIKIPQLSCITVGVHHSFHTGNVPRCTYEKRIKATLYDAFFWFHADGAAPAPIASASIS